ncbi:QueT transporter family protein, partial [bacterium]|nr:QueT transporter family protein [bacterium]
PSQCRVPEPPPSLPASTPAALPGLWLGAVLANAFMLNQFGVLALFDVVFGSLASLAGAWWTWRHRDKPLVALAGPVVANALIVPAYLPLMLSGATGIDFYSVPLLGIDASASWWSMYLFGVGAVGLGQAVVVYGLGWPLLSALKRLGVGRMLGDAS